MDCSCIVELKALYFHFNASRLWMGTVGTLIMRRSKNDRICAM